MISTYIGNGYLFVLWGSFFLFAGVEPKISSFKPSHYTHCGSQTAMSCHRNHLACHRSGVSFELINAKCYFVILFCKLMIFQMTH